MSARVMPAFASASSVTRSSFSAWARGGDLGDDAAEGRVQVGLAGHHVRQDIRARTGAAQNGRAGVVVSCFQAEDREGGRGHPGASLQARGLAGNITPMF